MGIGELVAGAEVGGGDGVGAEVGRLVTGGGDGCV